MHDGAIRGALRRTDFGFLSRLRQSVASGIHRASERDRRMVTGLNLTLLNDILWPLFIGYLCLSFLDVYSTILAFKVGPLFQERNIIAAVLFSLRFNGFLVAMLLKYLPAIPLFYLVFLKDPLEIHPYEVRLVKFGALCALCAADIFLLYVVGINNIPQLVWNL